MSQEADHTALGPLSPVLGGEGNSRDVGVKERWQGQGSEGRQAQGTCWGQGRAALWQDPPSPGLPSVLCRYLDFV